ncbi:MAG: glycosyltransferase family A protein, partial [Pseudomonadales bacterium]
VIEVLPDLDSRYRYVLTIPAFDEPADFLHKTLGTMLDRDDVVTIVVANVPDNATPVQIENTHQMFSTVRSLDHVVAIERISEPIPRRQGVGLARKIAADLVCALIARGDVDCPLIFMTDADAKLPPDYFELGQRPTSPITEGVFLFPFHHHAKDRKLQPAADLYELHIRHYVGGLKSAGSPYAFQCLGSTIAIHADTYAAVRGVPARNAAEDFYLLNKSAKVAPITCLATPRIEVAARPSHRVPFGTGPALMSMPDDVESFTSYNPQIFKELSSVLQNFKNWGLSGGSIEAQSEVAATCLGTLNWPDRALKLAHQHPPGGKRLRAVTEWFDGFRTLRFLRMLADQMPHTPLLATLRSQHHLPAADSSELLTLLRSEDSLCRLGIPDYLQSTVETSAPIPL